MPYKRNYFPGFVWDNFKKNYLPGFVWDNFIKKFLCNYKKFPRNYKKNLFATIKKCSLQL